MTQSDKTAANHSDHDHCHDDLHFHIDADIVSANERYEVGDTGTDDSGGGGGAGECEGRWHDAPCGRDAETPLRCSVCRTNACGVRHHLFWCTGCEMYFCNRHGFGCERCDAFHCNACRQPEPGCAQMCAR